MELKEFDACYIQRMVGYNFKNQSLLRQAFTRRSFSQENPEYADNEVLEFYGDVALNLYVSSGMCELFGKIDNGQYFSEKREGELSKIRSWYVNRNKLSHCITVLGLECYLVLGSSDIKNKVWENDSVKEDLFESILGAVAIDSSWKSDDIKTVCKNLFSCSDIKENYIALLDELCKKKGFETPRLEDKNLFRRSSMEYRHTLKPFSNISECGIIPEELCYDIPNIYRHYKDCSSPGNLNETHPIMRSAKDWYEWLLRRDEIQKTIGEIDENLAVNQLHELRQKELISEPVYNFTELHDKDGNPIWKCSCKISECDIPFVLESASKKKAKQLAAFHALLFFVGEENRRNTSEGAE